MTYPEPDHKHTAILSIGLSICFVICGFNMIENSTQRRDIKGLRLKIQSITSKQKSFEFKQQAVTRVIQVNKNKEVIKDEKRY